jgi:hypothetical protein
VITPLQLSAAQSIQVRYIIRVMKISLTCIPFLGVVALFPLIFVSFISNGQLQEGIVIWFMSVLALACIIVVCSIRIFGTRLIGIIDNSMALLHRQRIHTFASTKDKRLIAGRRRIIILVRAWTGNSSSISSALFFPFCL